MHHDFLLGGVHSCSWCPFNSLHPCPSTSSGTAKRSFLMPHLAAWQPRVWDSLHSQFTALMISSMDKVVTWTTDRPLEIQVACIKSFKKVSVSGPSRWRCSQETGHPRPEETTALYFFSSGNSRSCALCAAPRTPWSFSPEVSALSQDTVCVKSNHKHDPTK